MHPKMHVLRGSVMEKQISVKYFSFFQCLKYQMKSHKLRILEPSKAG